MSTLQGKFVTLWISKLILGCRGMRSEHFAARGGAFKSWWGGWYAMRWMVPGGSTDWWCKTSLVYPLFVEIVNAILMLSSLAIALTLKLRHCLKLLTLNASKSLQNFLNIFPFFSLFNVCLILTSLLDQLVVKRRTLAIKQSYQAQAWC